MSPSHGQLLRSFKIDGMHEGGRGQRRGGACLRGLQPHLNAFTGAVAWVRIDIDSAAADIDRRINAEERFHLAMAKQ